jgi:hypothetical protein
MVVDFFRCSRCNLTYRENTNGLPCADDGEFHDWIDVREAAKQVAPVSEDFRKTFTALGAEIGALVEKKQFEYGDSFTKIPKILEIMYPAGISWDEYAQMALVVRILDKLNRVAMGNQGDESAFKDIAGYALLALKRGL